MAGGMAAVLVMMCLLVGTGIIGLYIAAYAAHCFLVTIEQTASGSDEVVYPDESLYDWCWKVIYLLWLTAIWLVPLWLLQRNGYIDWPFVPLAVGFLWLTFPVCLFSSFGSESFLVVFRFDVLWRLLRQPVAVLSFYVLSALLLAAIATLAHFTLIGWREVQDAINAGRAAWLSPVVQWWSWIFALPLSALLLAAGLLWYGRLLGRLAALINPQRRRRRRPPALEQPLPIAEAAKALARSKSGEAERKAPAFAADETYALQDDEPETALEAEDDEEPPDNDDDDEEDADRRPAPGMWSVSVFRFPFYPRSLKALGWLTFDALALMLLFRALAAVWAL